MPTGLCMCQAMTSVVDSEVMNLCCADRRGVIRIVAGSNSLRLIATACNQASDSETGESNDIVLVSVR